MERFFNFKKVRRYKLFIFYQQNRLFIVDLLMIFTIGEKNTEDKLHHSLSNYHKNIKLTIEVSATKFLDTHLFNQHGTSISQVHRKETKTLTHW